MLLALKCKTIAFVRFILLHGIVQQNGAASQNATQIRFGNHVDGRPKSDLPLICGQVQRVRGAYYLTTGAAGGRASQLMFT